MTKMITNMLSDRKVYDYVVVLKNDHKQSIEKTGWLLSLFTCLVSGISVFINHDSMVMTISFIICCSLLLSNFYEKRKKKDVRFKTILIIGGMGLLIGSPVPFIIGIMMILSGLVENTLFLKREFGFSSEMIRENGLFGKKIRWDQLNRVILKDDILTIDFKSNKIFQAYIDDEENEEYEVGMEEFNTYCQNRIGLT